MSFTDRLKNIEQGIEQLTARGRDAADYRAFVAEFLAADPAHVILTDRLAQKCGTRNLSRLVAMKTPLAELGELRRAAGMFCQRNRYRFPGAELIRVRSIPGKPSRAIITSNGDAGTALIQIFESQQMDSVESVK